MAQSPTYSHFRFFDASSAQYLVLRLSYTSCWGAVVDSLIIGAAVAQEVERSLTNQKAGLIPSPSSSLCADVSLGKILNSKTACDVSSVYESVCLC